MYYPLVFQSLNGSSFLEFAPAEEMATWMDDEDSSMIHLLSARTLKRSISEESGFLSADPDTLSEITLDTNKFDLSEKLPTPSGQTKISSRTRDEIVTLSSTYTQHIRTERISSTLFHESNDCHSEVYVKYNYEASKNSKLAVGRMMKKDGERKERHSARASSVREQKRKANLKLPKNLDENDIDEVILPTGRYLLVYKPSNFQCLFSFIPTLITLRKKILLKVPIFYKKNVTNEQTKYGCFSCTKLS